QQLARRFRHAAPGTNAAGAVFSGVALFTCGLAVDLGAAQARQNVGHLAGDQMVAVQLGGDLLGEAQLAPGRLDLRGVRYRANEVAAHGNEAFDAPLDEALAGFDGIDAILAWRLEAELPP